MCVAAVVVVASSCLALPIGMLPFSSFYTFFHPVMAFFRSAFFAVATAAAAVASALAVAAATAFVLVPLIEDF